MSKGICFAAITALIVFFQAPARAAMIFLNLNNAPDEIRHCRDGLEKGGHRRESLEVISPKGYELTADESEFKSATYHMLRRKLREMRSKKIPVDSLVISGDDGTGQFTGSDGEFHYTELQDLLKEFPEAGKALKTSALWGCYTTTVDATDQYWLKNLPNMQFTMGFTTQGPAKTREANHVLLKQFCEKHKEAAELTTRDELCAFYNNLKHAAPTSVAVCNREAIAGTDYGVSKDGNKCLTYDELNARCPSVVLRLKGDDTYRQYASGEREPEDEVPGRVNELRRYYNDIQKWQQCAEMTGTDRGSDFPSPDALIRLIKFKKIKSALAELNKDELEDYDAELEAAGLDELKLGDIKTLSRRQMIQKINAAVTALGGDSVEVPVAGRTNRPKCSPASTLFGGCDDRAPASLTVRTAKNPALLRMAQCLNQVFVNNNPDCTKFDAVGDRPRSRSYCILSHDEASKKRNTKYDPC